MTGIIPSPVIVSETYIYPNGINRCLYDSRGFGCWFGPLIFELSRYADKRSEVHEDTTTRKMLGTICLGEQFFRE
ncbi:hypothetical protein B1F79_01045 [Coxiella-like endosymbiont of Rhipicephalus sanguineus]|nr:hypothetical protein [Coxiella-like endosymbiont of Rhipicephalus sanguineus]